MPRSTCERRREGEGRREKEGVRRKEREGEMGCRNEPSYCTCVLASRTESRTHTERRTNFTHTGTQARRHAGVSGSRAGHTPHHSRASRSLCWILFSLTLSLSYYLIALGDVDGGERPRPTVCVVLDIALAAVHKAFLGGRGGGSAHCCEVDTRLEEKKREGGEGVRGE